MAHNSRLVSPKLFINWNVEVESKINATTNVRMLFNLKIILSLLHNRNHVPMILGIKKVSHMKIKTNLVGEFLADSTDNY